MLPGGALEPGAPQCIRQRILPSTAGHLYGAPDRVFAPQRGLDSIGPVLRGMGGAALSHDGSCALCYIARDRLAPVADLDYCLLLRTIPSIASKNSHQHVVRSKFMMGPYLQIAVEFV